MEMAKADTGDEAFDALAWYRAEFEHLGMSNDAPGADTLRHLFVLLMGLGMRESSGQHCVGRDQSASNTTAETAEAGPFQQSWNARNCCTDFVNLFAQYGLGSDVQGYMGVWSEGVSCSASDWEAGSGDVLSGDVRHAGYAAGPWRWCCAISGSTSSQSTCGRLRREADELYRRSRNQSRARVASPGDDGDPRSATSSISRRVCGLLKPLSSVSSCFSWMIEWVSRRDASRVKRRSRVQQPTAIREGNPVRNRKGSQLFHRGKNQPAVLALIVVLFASRLHLLDRIRVVQTTMLRPSSSSSRFGSSSQDASLRRRRHSSIIIVGTLNQRQRHQHQHIQDGDDPDRHDPSIASTSNARGL
jgi:hypothetical protein